MVINKLSKKQLLYNIKYIIDTSETKEEILNRIEVLLKTCE